MLLCERARESLTAPVLRSGVAPGPLLHLRTPIPHLTPEFAEPPAVHGRPMVSGFDIIVLISLFLLLDQLIVALATRIPEEYKE